MPDNNYTIRANFVHTDTHAPTWALTLLDVVATDAPTGSTGQQEKLVTVTWSAPAGLAKGSGAWAYNDNPDSSGGITAWDGAAALDGTKVANPKFAPDLIGFYSATGTADYQQFNFKLAAPNTTVYDRLYLVPGSAENKPGVEEHTPTGGSVSRQYVVAPPAKNVTGTETAPLVVNARMGALPTGWTSNPRIVIDSGGQQHWNVAVEWDWPVKDPQYASLGGVAVVLDDTYSVTDLASVSVGGPARYISTDQPVRPGKSLYDVALLSYNTSGQRNSLLAGVTPNIPFTIARALGPPGAEYAPNATNVTWTIAPFRSSDGSFLNYLTVTGTNPAASVYTQFGGFDIMVDRADGVGFVSLNGGRLLPLDAYFANPATSATWTFALVALNTNNQLNSVVPGVTPEFTSAVGTSTGQLDLSKAAYASLSQEFSTTGDVLHLDTISADLLKAGAMQVGGFGKVSQVKGYDGLGGFSWFIGDDTPNTGFNGAWFKTNLRCGGSNPGNAPFQIDGNGKASITGAEFSFTYLGVTTTINTQWNPGIRITGSDGTSDLGSGYIALYGGGFANILELLPGSHVSVSSSNGTLALTPDGMAYNFVACFTGTFVATVGGSPHTFTVRGGIIQS